MTAILKQYALHTALALTALLVVVAGMYSFTQAAPVPERVIVTFENGDTVNEQAREALENAGAQVLKELGLINGFVVLIPEQAMGGVGALSGVKTVEKDVRVYALHHRDGHDGGPPGGGGDDGSGDGGSTQPAETLEWGVDRIDAELAWGVSRGTGIKTAIIDTGIDKDHADLVDNIKGGVNFVAKGPAWKTADPDAWDDDNGHGTHVAGIVAAADNDIGVIGTAPEAHLYGVKVLDNRGSGYLSDVIDGIGWSVDNNMDVINMSLGCNCDTVALKDAVDNAYNAGLVLVAAAGNSGDGDGSTNDVIYPAKYASVVAVSATDENDGTPAWSSEGEEVELAAPGVSIRSTWNDGLYNTISGTSMASPHTAGVAALVLATAIPSEYDADSDGLWSPAEVRTALRGTADDLGPEGHDTFYGHGLVDAEEATTGSETN